MTGLGTVFTQGSHKVQGRTKLRIFAMSRLGHIADLENINPVSGLLSYQSRQDGKVQLSTQGSKDAHAAALKWPARRPLSDVTAHFTFQLGRVEEVNALRAHTLFPGKPTEPRQVESIFRGPSTSLDGSHCQAVARNSLRRMR